MRARHRHTQNRKRRKGDGAGHERVSFNFPRDICSKHSRATVTVNANVVPELRGKPWSCGGVAVVCLLPEDRPSSALAAAPTALLVNAAFVGGGEGRPSVFSGLGVLRYNHMTAGDNQPKRSLCRLSVERGRAGEFCVIFPALNNRRRMIVNH